MRQEAARAPVRTFLLVTALLAVPASGLVQLFAGPVAAQDPAVVTASRSSGKVTAGECLRLIITVAPDKAGQTVDVQRRKDHEWFTIAQALLSTESRARAPVCFRWADLGTVRLRAAWFAQDTDNTDGFSPRVDLRVVKARWMRRIDRLVGGRAMSVSIGLDNAFVYRRKDSMRRAPASNEKLLLSMAILDRLGPDFRIATLAAADRVDNGVVKGPLWILGRGDPEGGRARMRRLAVQIAAAGIRKIRGRVLGSIGYFARDWWAPGWKSYFPRVEIPLPTALTFGGNSVHGHHIRDPERRTAVTLTKQLRRGGIRVGGRPGASKAPRGLQEVASIASAPLIEVLRRQNVDSRNFYAEVLGKLLGAKRSGAPGTIAKGAAAIEAWARRHGANVLAKDSSGLSYNNRVSSAGMVRLLQAAGGETWVDDLRGALPTGGQGTLAGRLGSVQVRAKTGTLDAVSALSGWVWLERLGRWAEFSILSRGMAKSTAVRIEDDIVRTIAANAR